MVEHICVNILFSLLNCTSLWYGFNKGICFVITKEDNWVHFEVTFLIKLFLGKVNVTAFENDKLWRKKLYSLSNAV